MRRRIDPAAIQARLDKGETLAAIARDTGFLYDSLWSALGKLRRRVSVGRPNCGTLVAPWEREYVRDNWQSLSDCEMAAHLGRTPAGIAKIRKQLRLVRAKQPPPKINKGKRPELPISLPPGCDESVDRIVRCRLHLLDIKRAGYPYAFGEPGRAGYAPL